MGWFSIPSWMESHKSHVPKHQPDISQKSLEILRMIMRKANIIIITSEKRKTRRTQTWSSSPPTQHSSAPNLGDNHWRLAWCLKKPPKDDTRFPTSTGFQSFIYSTRFHKKKKVDFPLGKWKLIFRNSKLVGQPPVCSCEQSLFLPKPYGRKKQIQYQAMQANHGSSSSLRSQFQL